MPRKNAKPFFDQMSVDSGYARMYEDESRRIRAFDDVIRSLDKRREELGLSKADLARQARMAPEAMRRLFSQQHKNPTLTTVIAVADALRMRLALHPFHENPPMRTRPGTITADEPQTRTHRGVA